jgi:glycosyltransferase involved in cell wall biosynthesis
MTQLQIIVPLWNEEKNIPNLLAMFDKSPLVQNKILSFILVNNGSTDNSKEILETLCQSRPWIHVLNLPENQNYGGGILQGLKQSNSTFIGFIPGDLQVHISDVEKIWDEICICKDNETTLFKGYRTLRMDGKNTQFVSKVYTKLANKILDIKVKDINGLPKIFHLNLLSLLATEVMKTFVLDAQIIATAHHHGWKIQEVPVTFHARREGVSSWSGKRMRVYIQSLKMLLTLRRKKLTMPQVLNSKHES